MYKNLKIVRISSSYCDYLRKYDNNVMYNYGLKELRPFVGVLFMVNDIKYFAPLASPKEKHLTMPSQIDIVKIDNGRYGVINLNNMIPVTDNNYEVINLNDVNVDINTQKRYQLIKKQLRFINLNKKEIYFKSRILYHSYKDNTLVKRIKNRCCNFILLEEICNNYNIINKTSKEFIP